MVQSRLFSSSWSNSGMGNRLAIRSVLCVVAGGAPGTPGSVSDDPNALSLGAARTPPDVDISNESERRKH